MPTTRCGAAKPARRRAARHRVHRGTGPCLGLKPGGTNGTFYEYMPVTATFVDSASTITAAARPSTSIATSIGNVNGDPRAGQAIFGGTQGDTTNALTAEQVKGKVVLMLPSPRCTRCVWRFRRRGRGAAGGAGRSESARRRGGGADRRAGARAGQPAYQLHDTVQDEGRAAYLAAHPDTTARGRGGRGGRGGFGGAGGASSRRSSPAVAAATAGQDPAAQAAKGDLGQTWRIDAHISDRPIADARRGRDPAGHRSQAQG